MFKDTSFLSRMATKPKPIGLVYFVSAKHRPFPVKIGRTTNFFASKRLVQLQMGCPYDLEFLAAIEAPAEHERELHERFAQSALRGEWFHRSRELSLLMSDIRKENPRWRTLLRTPVPGGIGASGVE